jgi:hypothetical protein
VEGLVGVFAPEGVAPGDVEPVVGAEHKVREVGFGDGGVVQVVPAQWPSHRSLLNTKD